jgi:hypothetical protein
MLRNLGFESPSWEDLTYVLIALVVTASLLGAAWTLWELHRQDPWLRLLHLAGQRLTRAGMVLPANTPPRHMAALLQAHTGDAQAVQRDAIAQWLLRMEAWRYAPTTLRMQSLATLQREFKQLPWPPQQALASPEPAVT